jgi:ankyrin repeat protein
MYLLSQKGVNVNTKGKYGRTLLHYACNKINSLPIGIFQYLIETLGFDVNTPNIFKDTPLLRALCSFNPNGPGDINVLTYLIDHMNVNLNIKGHCDRTLLHYACIKHLSGSWDSIEINAKTDTHSCQMVELIVERCIRQVLDETTP